MRQGLLTDLVWEGRGLTCPIPEGGTEAVNGDVVRLDALQNLGHRSLGERFVASGPREYEVADASLQQIHENGDGSTREWHAVLPTCLHAVSGNDPDCFFKVDLFPAGAAHLA